MGVSRWRWAPVLAYMAFIFVLSSIANTPTLPSSADKWVHALLYAGLSALLVRALTDGWRLRVRPALALTAVVIAAAYGASDEFHQRFVPPRQADVFDVVADALGASVAAGGLYAWDIIRRRHAL